MKAHTFLLVSLWTSYSLIEGQYNFYLPNIFYIYAIISELSIICSKPRFHVAGIYGAEVAQRNGESVPALDVSCHPPVTRRI